MGSYGEVGGGGTQVVPKERTKDLKNVSNNNKHI